MIHDPCNERQFVAIIIIIIIIIILICCHVQCTVEQQLGGVAGAL
jgi:uncharacterized alpha/beta hydrolase family protein